MVANPAIPTEKADGMAALVKEKVRLSTLLQTIKNRITEIKVEFPYTMKEVIQSPDKIEARKAELQEQIDQLTDVLAAYNEKIAEMLR